MTSSVVDFFHQSIINRTSEQILIVLVQSTVETTSLPSIPSRFVAVLHSLIIFGRKKSKCKLSRVRLCRKQQNNFHAENVHPLSLDQAAMHRKSFECIKAWKPQLLPHKKDLLTPCVLPCIASKFHSRVMQDRVKKDDRKLIFDYASKAWIIKKVEKSRARVIMERKNL